MKKLEITICDILYTNKDIEKVRRYTEKIKGTTLEMKLHDICTDYIDKALEQIREFEKTKKE